MKKSVIKANGVHYTPPALADFLASVTAERLAVIRGEVEVLDPACGNGALLYALAHAVPVSVRKRLVLVGYETDPIAIQAAEKLLGSLGVCRIDLRMQDFLDAASSGMAPIYRGQRSLLESDATDGSLQFDAVIANPPYVRTQVLGASKAQSLAKRFRLTGRVDLYHAFARAMIGALKNGGVLGLLTSNRFLTIKSGMTLRTLMKAECTLRAIYDLGDTKLFSAAVLPVIVVATKDRKYSDTVCSFDRVYQQRSTSLADRTVRQLASVPTALRDRCAAGSFRTPEGTFVIERGVLSTAGQDEVWSLSTPHYEEWLKTVAANQLHAFDEVARVRVGIKTTADDVFIRDDWSYLSPDSERPEPELVRPLIRHFDAARWVWSGMHRHSVLYPHMMTEGKRGPVDLREYPRARKYLEARRDRLTRRRYVIEGGRQWYEIWVPHSPDEWAKPKIVFPDIAETPKFFLDTTGAVVNGDCYWMSLRRGFDSEWLKLILAVANSTFITRYYDIAFHNKLYAGRRRFMTQYVRTFPLPNIRGKAARKAIALVSRLLAAPEADRGLEARIDDAVWESFGLTKEVAR